MIDPFDYKEPSCTLCGGKDFYYPKKDAPKGKIPVSRIIEKVDEAFNKNDMQEAKRLLEYWKKEAQSLLDKKGELSVVNELLGLYRKLDDAKNAEKVAERAVILVKELGLEEDFSVGNIYLNVATTLKAIKKARESIFYYDEAYKIFTKFPERSKDLMSGYYNNRAVALVDLGEVEKAKECYYKALEYLKGTPFEFTDGAITMVNLAHLYFSMDLEHKAKECVEKIILLLENEKVIKNGYYAYVLTKCTPALRHFGFTEKAEEYEKLAEQIYEGN